MSKLEYSISDLHNLLDLNLRKSMFLNTNSDMYQVALENKQNIESNGNPIYNKLYKNMKINVLRDHLNYAGNNKREFSNEEGLQEYDYLIDDGQIEKKSTGWRDDFDIRQLSPYSSRSNLSKYQPYFKPTGRLSDFATLYSTGTVGLKYKPNSKRSTLIGYSDYYNDKDLSCVSVIIDVGKNSTVVLDEHFLNKDGMKIFKIIYLVRDYSKLIINRKQDITNKDIGGNIIESNVIQFPGSSFEYNISGEGSKYNQDLMYIDVYDDCLTKVNGKFDLYGNYVNNNLIQIHHKAENSKSIVDVKTIVEDKSHSSFLGSIIVDKNAVNTDASLINKNLLLSNDATAITEPQLDINTKEISCSHGCTVSNIDPNELYYLESRGIETHMAEETIKQCFLTT